MKKMLLMAFAAALMMALPLSASTVCTFEGLADGVVPDGYCGITWNGQWTNYSEPQPPYNPHSGTNRVYTFNSLAEFDFLTPTTFQGAWFAGNPFATVQFDEYLGGVLVATSGVLAPTDVPAFLASGYNGMVDEIIVSSPSPDFYIMDDVTYGGNTPIPEPGSIFLLGSGILGVAGVVRRRMNV